MVDCGNDDGVDSNWVDATALFRSAKLELRIGELIHMESFSLFASMSTIQLMDPKMDTGCGKLRSPSKMHLPHSLSDEQLLAVMDNLTACEVSWLHCHTLPQTVFSCLYHQGLLNASRVELLTFLRLQLGTMHLMLKIVRTERIAEEEDFICWTYGFRLPSLTVKSAQDLVADVAQQLSSKDRNHSESSEPLRLAIYNRLQFRLLLFQLISALYYSENVLNSDSSALLRDVERLLTTCRRCSPSSLEFQSLLGYVFDPSINRHLLTNTPPRSVPVFCADEAFDQLHSLLRELKAFIAVQRVILPRNRQHEGGQLSLFSFNCVLHAMCLFSAQTKPSILTRSIFGHLMLAGQTTFSISGRTISKMLVMDAMPSVECSDKQRSEAEILAPFAEHFIWALLRNRGRQRRFLVKSLATWDRAVDLTVNGSGRDFSRNGSTGESRVNGNGSQDGSKVFCGKNPFELVCYEISARMVAQHLLLGFECGLYLPHELSAVYFYLGYVFSAGTNASASVLGRQSSKRNMGPRLALYLIDEGRLWLCRALCSLFEAISLDIMSVEASTKAREANDTEHLWYEQRFGFTRTNRVGPAYVDYRTFRSLMELQQESLLETSGVDDVFVARLDDAASGFISARRALERASRACKELNWTDALTDVQALAKVAVTNSVRTSEKKRIYLSRKQKHHVLHDRGSISVRFDLHEHFAVVDCKCS